MLYFNFFLLITSVLSGTTAKCNGAPDNPPGCTPPPPPCDELSWIEKLLRSDCDRRRSLSEDVEKYHCFRFVSELSAVAECSTISPPKFVGNDYTNVDAIETWAASQVKYWCCRLQKDSRFGLMSAALEFNQMCWSNRVLLHSEEIFENAARAVPEKKMDMFSDLIIYCPSRYGAKTSVDFTHIEGTIRENLNGGPYVTAEATCNSTDTKTSETGSETGTFTVVLDLETGASQFGHMVGFFGDIKDLNQENYVSWGPEFLDVDQESFDLLLGGKGMKQPIDTIKVSDAIQFTGVNVQEMKEAWKIVQDNSYYSLLEYNCVYAIWEILMPQLNCKSRDKDIFFAVPTKLFHVLLGAGAETGMGQRIVDEQQKTEISNKFHTMATNTNEERLSNTSDSLISPSCGLSNAMYASVAMVVTGMFLVGFEFSRRCYNKDKYTFEAS